MMDLLSELNFVLVCVGDVSIIQREGETEKDHLIKVAVALGRLQIKGIKANLRKSFFMQSEVEHIQPHLTLIS